MTSPAPVLTQHLLTRADLARMGIPAGSILAWLADRLLDPVGSLPGPDAGRDEVLAVLDQDLRLYLASKVAAIGKDAIVFTPARVRSVLQRAMTARRATNEAAAPPPADAAPIPQVQDATGDGVFDAAAAALEVTAEMLEHEIEAFVEMTRQEAQLEAIELAASAPDAGGPSDANAVNCFDAEDLIGELGKWASPDPAAPTTVPTVEPAPAAAAATPASVDAGKMHAPAPSSAAVEANPAAAAVAEAAPPSRRPAEPAAEPALARFESSLGELRDVLVQLANRPQPQPVDMGPLVAAVQSGFVHSAAGASATHTALASLAERLGDLGKRVEVGVAQAVRTALDREVADPAASARPAPFVVARTDRSTIALFGIGFLLLCWTAIFWFKTGSPRFAFGALVGANLIGCCLVVGRRRSC